MALSLTSVSPAFGPPGTAIALTGTGFDAGSQVGCPALVPTAFVSSTQLTAAIPEGIEGPDGGALAVAVFVFGSDGSVSNTVVFTVQFPRVALQAWTLVDAVAGEVPGFARGGQITDDQIARWIATTAQTIAASMARRGLSLDPASWALQGANAVPSPASILELINRLGAAATLAGAVSSLFSQGDSALAKNLMSQFTAQIAALDKGSYDNIFNPTAVTELTGPAFGSGDMTDCNGRADPAFRKEQRF